jgi:hypothetical protein
VLEIKEHIASEELLKMYFFKLYARKNEFPYLYFHEDVLNDIIHCKTLSQMNSNELFECIKIERRGFGFDSSHESFDDFIPSKFYFIDVIENSNETIFEHSFLYTNFKLIDGIELYEAEIGLWSLGCDLINEDGVILKTITPNLYDNGYYEIKVFSKNYPIFLLIEYDKNNGDWLTFYSFKNNQLIEVDEIGDKFLILDFLKFGCSGILALASEDIKDDKELLLAAINIDSNSLNFASDRLRNDKNIVLKAVSQDGSSLEYASEELRNDREVVFAAVSNFGNSLRDASVSLRNEKDIVLKAVSKNGKTLEYASEELRNDREVVFTAVSNNGYAIKYVGEKLKKDSEILAIVNVKKDTYVTNSDESISDDLPF